MSTLRAIVVILIAVSVAMLPISTGMAIAGTAVVSAVATQPGCCDHGQPCKGKNAGGCVSPAGCALKCGSVSAAIVGTALRLSPRPKTGTLPLFAWSLFSPSYNPPLPPPRV